MQRVDDPATPVCVLQMPRFLLAQIMSRMAPPAIRALAATSTAGLQATLEGCARVCFFKADAGLAACVSGLALSTQRRHWHRVSLTCRLPPGQQNGRVVFAPLHHLPLLCAEAASVNAGELALLSPNARAVVTNVMYVTGAARLPIGMHSLQTAMFRGRGPKPMRVVNGWLPNTSSSHLRQLDVRHTTLTARFPKGLRHLEVLNVSECSQLSSLPTNSVASLRVLHADASALECLPSDMTALQTLSVEDCGQLSSLPASSSQAMRELLAAGSALETLPARMPALRLLDVRRCKRFGTGTPAAIVGVTVIM